MLLPHTAIFLPYLIEELTICCTRCTFDAKVATTILFELFKNSLSNTYPNELSDIVISESNASIPLFPSSAILFKSITLSSIGV